MSNPLMCTLTLFLLLLFAPPPPPPPATATCVGVEQCQAAAAAERRAAEQAKAEEKRRIAELAAAKAKLDTCKGLSACKKAEAAVQSLQEPSAPPEVESQPEGPTEAELAETRLEIEDPKERSERRRHDRRSARRSARSAAPQLPTTQRPGTLVLGAGYAGMAFQYADPSLPYMDGLAWSARAYQNWFFPETNVQMSLGAGFQGMHVYGVVDEQVPAYGPTIPATPITVHHLTVPVEFRLGGPARDDLFIYGMVGGSLGFAVISDNTDSAVAFVYQPILLGAGAYTTLGDSNLILGGEVRTDVAGGPFAGPPVFDLQLKFGLLF